MNSRYSSYRQQGRSRWWRRRPILLANLDTAASVVTQHAASFSLPSARPFTYRQRKYFGHGRINLRLTFPVQCIHSLKRLLVAPVVEGSFPEILLQRIINDNEWHANGIQSRPIVDREANPRFMSSGRGSPTAEPNSDSVSDELFGQALSKSAPFRLGYLPRHISDLLHRVIQPAIMRFPTPE